MKQQVQSIDQYQFNSQYPPKGFIGMPAKKYPILVLFSFLAFIAGCSIAREGGTGPPQSAGPAPSATAAIMPSAASIDPTVTDIATINSPVITVQSTSSTQPVSPTSTVTMTSTATKAVYEVGREITVEYLRDLEITGSEITVEQELDQTYYYHQYIVSYISEGNKIYALLTIPSVEPPEGGFKAIVFNHGYIPPAAYRTTEYYTAYVDYLARSGFVVMKIDYRGHGQSEGVPSGSYFSPGYTIDSITALKSLQTMDIIDPQGIGMWGHSMAGNLVLRAMLIEPDIKAGVIWAGAVYSYDDFVKYGIDDNTYRPPVIPEDQEASDPRRRSREIFDTYGRPDTQVDYWEAVSLTENIEYLNSPIQLHHAQDDTVVNVGYSFDLAVTLQENGKQYELYTYEGGGHNLISPYFDQAMLRTVEFFRNNL
jgi:dipeptidyl aminopeptidase/acylaminoacyl peptidase